MKYTVKPTSKFQKDLKRIQKRGYDIGLITDIIATAIKNTPYIVKSFFLENQGFFSVSSINISEEGAIEMDISLYLVRK